MRNAPLRNIDISTDEPDYTPESLPQTANDDDPLMMDHHDVSGDTAR